MRMDVMGSLEYFRDYYLRNWVQWIEKNPATFIYYVILALTPFLGLSAFFSWKMSKELSKEAKEKKQKESRTRAILAAKERNTSVKKNEPEDIPPVTKSKNIKHHKKKK